MKKYDLINKKFGFLTVIALSRTFERHTYWICKCECGKIIEVKGRNLVRCHVKSCGCYKVQDRKSKFLGTKVGYLTVIALHTERSKNQSLLWVCRCKCGKEVLRTSSELNTNFVASCGCRRSAFGKGNFNLLYSSYRQHATYRGFAFNLEKDEFEKLIGGNCVYCGNPPCNIRRASASSPELIYNGIDRIDSTKGYYIGNVVSCCKYCNQMKMNHTLDFFLGHIKKIYAHHIMEVKKEQSHA